MGQAIENSLNFYKKSILINLRTIRLILNINNKYNNNS